MTRNLQRIGGIGGLAFVALFVSLFVIHPDSGETNREILAYYENAGNRTTEYLSSAIAAAAAIALLIFASAVAAILARAASGPNIWSYAALAGGASSAVLLLVGRGLSLGIVAAYDYEQFQLDPNVARVVESAGFLLIVAAVMALSLLALAVGLVARETRTLPTWLAWMSLVTAVLALAAAMFLPIFLVLLWMLIVSVTLLRTSSA